MKKKQWLISVLSILALPAVASAGPLGAPGANVPAGKLSVGIEGDYGTRKQEYDATVNQTYRVRLSTGILTERPEAFSESGTDKLKTTAAFLKPAYGVTDKINLFARIGLSNVKGGSDDCEDDPSGCVSSDNASAYGAGVQATLFENEKVRVGLTGQATVHSSRKAGVEEKLTIDPGSTMKYDSGRSYSFPNGDTWTISNSKIKWTEYEAALGAAFKLGQAVPYVGVNYSKASAKFTSDLSSTFTSSGSLSIDYKEKSPFGVHGGVAVSLSNNMSLGAEVRLLNQTALSISLGYAF
jgi:opacity protein-like surface antigen